MNLHEYQAKDLLKFYSVPVPNYRAVSSVEEALLALKELGLESGRCVVKAQVHAGGRGKGQIVGQEDMGGVCLVSSKAEVEKAVAAMLGSRLVTIQTTAEGQPISQVLIEAPANIKKELYLSATVDRVRQGVVFMASTEGGMDIEEVAEKTPEKIFSFAVDPLVGLLPYQCRALGFNLGLNNDQIKILTRMLHGMYEMFMEKDLSLLEVNPLVITEEDTLVCLDAKINIDGNALYRHKDLCDIQDTSQDDAREIEAAKWDLNYIALDGDIGCMVNGAGLAMATMDLIQLHGGRPANFLDVGGGTTQERVSEAFKLIVADSQVKAILVNIFGGIVRCDLIADGLIQAIAQVGIKHPVVVRLEGNRAELGQQKLAASGLNIVAIDDFDEAAKKAVELAGENA